MRFIVQQENLIYRTRDEMMGGQTILHVVSLARGGLSRPTGVY